MNAPDSYLAPPPALVVISGGPRAERCPSPTTHSDPAWTLLRQALPDARRVLELGCAQGELAQAYKHSHPNTHWLGVDRHPHDLERAKQHMDEALCLDLTHASIQTIESTFDLIIINRLEHLPQPARTLSELGPLLAPGGALIVLAENHACLSAVAHLLEADLSTGVAASATDERSLNAAHPRHQSPSSIYKLLMDAGWMPNLVATLPDEPLNEQASAAARLLASSLDIAPGNSEQVNRVRHLIIRAERCFDTDEPTSTAALFDVVVPTTNERQLRVNVEQSPGLQEVQARIVSYRLATSPAQALTESLQHVNSPWVLLCHQDVYFPKGFGQRLNALLSTIPDNDRASTLLGFIGMGVNRQTQHCETAGFVIDRQHCASHPESDSAVSIDELALVVARDSIHRIDPHIGWHLWATDLCLTAISEHRVFPRIARLPLFHNSQSGWTLPAAFMDSAEYLLQKHASFSPIHTLCGVIDPGFIAQHRSTQA